MLTTEEADFVEKFKHKLNDNSNENSNNDNNKNAVHQVILCFFFLNFFLYISFFFFVVQFTDSFSKRGNQRKNIRIDGIEAGMGYIDGVDAACRTKIEN